MTSVSVAALEDTIASVAARCLRTSAPIGGGTRFDELGLDSLATIELAAALETELGCELPADVIAEGCSARSLAARLLREGALVRRDDRFEQMLADAVLPDDVLVASAFPPSLKLRRASRRKNARTDLRTARTILLTGATGFLGGALLEELLRTTTATIVCLARHVPEQPVDHRVRFIAADLTHPALGLAPACWTELAQNVDAVVHCAATVNWVYSYASLRAANVGGTVELLRLACGAGAAFHFISSVSVCYSTDVTGVVDETFDALPAIRGVHLGYAQTKVVAEALVRQAGARGLPVSIYRPALISGHSVTGVYNRDDVVATLIRGCVAMKTAPDLDWNLDAVPVDVVARAVVGLSEQEGDTFHIAHARPRHWRECVLWMRMKGYDVRLTSYPAWLRQLEHETQRDAAHPLRALRSFFLDRPANGLTLPELYEDSRRAKVTCEMSRIDAGCPPLDAALLDTYFDAFVATGDLPRACLLPPKGGSHKGGSHNPPAVASAFRRKYSAQPAGSEHSIVSELTAWRSGTPTGLFMGPDAVVKVKARDTDVIAVGEALADLVDPAVGGAYRRWSGRIGFTGSHVREVAIYRQTDPRFVAHTPRVLETVIRRHHWIVALERIDDAVLIDSAMHPERWSQHYIERAIDGLAALQAVWVGREAELRAQPWIAYIQSAASMAEMTDLWTALSAHAAPHFAAWGGRDLPRIHGRLVERVGDWWPALERGPRTLIHHDFNPRNICLRGDEATLCAYDWELATLGAPQRDLAEFLCFVMPTDAGVEDVRPWIERHRAALQSETGIAIDAAKWLDGFSAALYDVLVNRLSIYTMVNRVRRQPFLPRVVASWGNLYRHFPLEACR